MTFAKQRKYRAFKVIYVGPTDTKGAQVIIKDLWYQERIKMPRDSCSNSFEQALTFLKQFIPIVGISCSGSATYDLILADNFECHLKAMKHEYDKNNS
jgi:hypothetical protein